MTAASAPAVLLGALVVGAALSAADLLRAQERTLVLYTTPALKDLLEKDVIPRYREETGQAVAPVYVAAGEQYNRLRLSGDSPEADLFLHASPLFLEKGHHDGYFAAVRVPEAEGWNETFRGREVDGGRVWYAFAWTPLVEVYRPAFAEPPDLAASGLRFGLAHPLLSNNGVYNALYFETVDPEAGRRAVERTTVQPTNARSSISALADGSFDVTLGYEAVTLFYQSRGADVRMSLPHLGGERHVVPVLFSAGLVKDHPHDEAERFLRFLFTNETQERLPRYFFRPASGDAVPEGGVDLAQAEAVRYDWSRWEELEASLKAYEVKT
ncbi:MAG TPA: substrate-binding domain-containing protein [Candidatus Thermoplasmatota archaeon]|nr:substrate-binding domain-containing protein [Candidatus Thermoplasmatota archaeon]